MGNPMSVMATKSPEPNTLPVKMGWFKESTGAPRSVTSLRYMEMLPFRLYVKSPSPPWYPMANSAPRLRAEATLDGPGSRPAVPGLGTYANMSMVFFS